MVFWLPVAIWWTTPKLGDWEKNPNSLLLYFKILWVRILDKYKVDGFLLLHDV